MLCNDYWPRPIVLTALPFPASALQVPNMCSLHKDYSLSQGTLPLPTIIKLSKTLTTAKEEKRRLAQESNNSSRWSIKFLDTYS